MAWRGCLVRDERVGGVLSLVTLNPPRAVPSGSPGYHVSRLSCRSTAPPAGALVPLLALPGRFRGLPRRDSLFRWDQQTQSRDKRTQRDCPCLSMVPGKGLALGNAASRIFLRQTCFPSALSSPPEDWLWSHLTLISGGSGCPRTSQAQFQFVSLMSWRFSFLYDPTCVSKAPFCYTTKLGSLLEIDMPSTSCHLTVSLFSHVPQAVPAE